MAITFPTFRESVKRQLAACLNQTELYGVQCRVEDAAGLTDAEREELVAMLAKRRAEVQKLHEAWRKQNGYPA